MALLAHATYDPASSVSKATSSLLAMTALDTTNLRVTFTAPPNGAVLVRLSGTLHGANTMAQILLGVLESSTVKGRMAPMKAYKGTALATGLVSPEAVFLVTGLTPGQEYTWDAAYGVETEVASSAIKYGGANNTSANDAFGAFVFEVWSTPALLAGVLYDPGSAQSKATTSAIALTALDTTNLRLPFTAPNSGRVLVRLQGLVHGASTYPQILLGVLDGSTVMGRASAVGGHGAPNAATSMVAQEALFAVDGLTPGQSYTWDAAYGVETVVASTALKYGGPNDTNADNAFGGFAFEIWRA